MTSHVRTIRQASRGPVKAEPRLPVLAVTGPQSVVILAGTSFAGHVFTRETPVIFPRALVVGADYAVILSEGKAFAWRAYAAPDTADVIGGFHYAPGRPAIAHKGGDDVPAVNPNSLWDINFRPKSPDPRGMFFIQGPKGPAWIDIYKLGKDHLKNGTSGFGVEIADGRSPPQNPAGGYFNWLNFATAIAVMKHHGKTLAAVDELTFAADGVTERSAAGRDPHKTGLDAPRTSKFGMMQATGNLWDWCHDGTAQQRSSLFGGSWWHAGAAGSRYAYVDYWGDYSYEAVGARGRSDHLQLD